MRETNSIETKAGSMDELQPRDREGLTSVLEELQPLDSLMSGRTEEVYLFSLCLMSDYDRDEGYEFETAETQLEIERKTMKQVTKVSLTMRRTPSLENETILMKLRVLGVYICLILKNQ